MNRGSVSPLFDFFFNSYTSVFFGFSVLSFFGFWPFLAVFAVVLFLFLAPRYSDLCFPYSTFSVRAAACSWRACGVEVA